MARRIRRHPKGQQELPTIVNDVYDRGGQTLDDLTEQAASRKKRKSVMSRKSFDRLAHDTAVMIEEKNFDTMKSKHLVMVYAILHERVYGVVPDELREAGAYGYASLAASKMLRFEFDNQPRAVAEFIRWTWVRERERIRRNPDRDSRIGWRLQFGKSFLTDYRAAKMRSLGKR